VNGLVKKKKTDLDYLPSSRLVTGGRGDVDEETSPKKKNEYFPGCADEEGITTGSISRQVAVSKRS